MLKSMELWRICLFLDCMAHMVYGFAPSIYLGIVSIISRKAPILVAICPESDVE